MMPEISFLTNYISSATTTEVKVGKGKLHTVTIGETAAGAITIYDAKYTPGYLTGDTGAQSTASTWAAVTDGEFAITIDGTARNITGISFAGCAAMADVAVKIQTAIRSATGKLETVTWSTNHFIITSVNTTSSSAVTVTSAVAAGAGTDISGAGASDWMDADTGNGTATAAAINATSTIAVLKASIAEQTFTFDANFNSGLVIVTAGASKLTVSYL